MDDTCQVRGTAALAVHVSSWLRDEEAAVQIRQPRPRSHAACDLCRWPFPCGECLTRNWVPVGRAAANPGRGGGEDAGWRWLSGWKGWGTGTGGGSGACGYARDVKAASGGLMVTVMVQPG
jgi:hypothetical protein